MELPSFLQSRLALVGVFAAMQGGEKLCSAFHGVSCMEEQEEKEKHLNHTLSLVKETIHSIIREHFPEHLILSMDEEYQKVEEIQWVVNPLDGKKNFSHGIHCFSLAIGVLISSEVVMTIIYNPMTRTLFLGEKGKGVFCNGKKVRVSETGVLDQAIMGREPPVYVEKEAVSYLDHFAHFVKLGIKVREFGSSLLSLGFVCSGQLDFSIHYLSPIGAILGQFLIAESGGIMTDCSGNVPEVNSGGVFIASNQVIHEQGIARIQHINELWNLSQENKSDPKSDTP